MRLICPCCHAVASLEAWLNNTEAREALAVAMQCPSELRHDLLRYMGLFRPAKSALSWLRVRRLLSEINEMIQTGKVVHKGIAHVAPLAAWRAALDQVLVDRGKLNLPLKSHGYLISIIAGYANKEAAQAEQAKEHTARSRGKSAEPVAVGAVVKSSPEKPIKRALPPEGWKSEALKRSRGGS